MWNIPGYWVCRLGCTAWRKNRVRVVHIKIVVRCVSEPRALSFVACDLKRVFRFLSKRNMKKKKEHENAQRLQLKKQKNFGSLATVVFFLRFGGVL